MEGNRLDPINKLIEYALTLKYEDLPVEVVGPVQERPLLGAQVRRVHVLHCFDGWIQFVDL